MTNKNMAPIIDVDASPPVPQFHVVIGTRGSGKTQRIQVIMKNIKPDRCFCNMIELQDFDKQLDDCNLLVRNFSYLYALDHLVDAVTPLLVLKAGDPEKTFFKISRLRRYIPKLNVIYETQLLSMEEIPIPVTSVDYAGHLSIHSKEETRQLLFPQVTKEDFNRILEEKDVYDFLHRDQDGTLCLYNMATMKELPQSKPKDTKVADEGVRTEELCELLVLLKELLEKVETLTTLENDCRGIPV